MSLLQKLDDDLKVALKASESLKVSVLGMAKAALKNKQINKGAADGKIVNQRVKELLEQA